MFFDAHTHISTEDYRGLLQNKDIVFMASASSAGQFALYERLQKEYANLHFSFGIHPWYAHKAVFPDALPYLEKCQYIGEIGMDSVWCQTPVHIQEQIFIEQLDYAQSKGKPVILHTKGCEKEIAGIIRNYTMPVLVHWYSCNDYVEGFMNRACYFTMGPDIRINKSVQRLAQITPVDRILVETDGIAAVKWALGKDIEPGAISAVLKDTIACLAEIKAINLEEMRRIVYKNSLEFFGLNPN